MGKLSKFKASDLGGLAIRGALDKINLPKEAIDEVILGNVCSAGLG
jgi:acetyl-CoA C-acetyltransferase